MIIKGGGPAFPCEHIEDACNARDGMSLRDWLAGLAMQGWISSLANGELKEIDEDPRIFKEHQEAVAKAAYGYADAMLKERER